MVNSTVSEYRCIALTALLMLYVATQCSFLLAKRFDRLPEPTADLSAAAVGTTVIFAGGGNNLGPHSFVYVRDVIKTTEGFSSNITLIEARGCMATSVVGEEVCTYLITLY